MHPQDLVGYGNPLDFFFESDPLCWRRQVCPQGPSALDWGTYEGECLGTTLLLHVLNGRVYSWYLGESGSQLGMKTEPGSYLHRQLPE